MTATTAGPPAAPRVAGAPARRAPRTSRHGLAGAASVLVSGLLALTWGVVSVTLLATGISSLLALGIGALLLVVWVLAMRAAASFERHRARAAHGIDVVVPARRVSTRGGFAGWLHTLWLDATSWPFWRSVLHHHAVMLVGLVFSSLFWAALMTAYVLGEAAARGIDAVFLGTHPGPLGLVGAAALLALLAVGVLAVGTVAERGLDRVMLPSGEDALREEVAELTEQRQGAVDAAEAERLRIERDLHDGVQPRLVALAMTLGMARPKITTDPVRAEQLVGEAHEESKAIMTELRQLARGIHPAVLTDRGLDAALSALAARSAIPVDLRVHLAARPGREAEAVAYFVVSEALTNIAKHSGADHARVDVRGDAGTLALMVEDDGVGGADVRRDGVSTGLAGLTDRVRATGGRLDIMSSPGHGTRLSAVIPLTDARKDLAR